MRRPSALAAALLLSACATEALPPAPGDDGARSRGGFGLPIFSGGGEAREDARIPAGAVRLTPEDQAVLSALKEIQAEALFDALARRGADARSLGVSREVLTARPIDLPPEGVAGLYRCRTLKHGGPAPLVAYGYFDCEVEQSSAGLVFRKTTGSQLMTGRLFADPGLGADGRRALAYAGTQHNGPGTDTYPAGQTEAGLFERTARTRYRLTIPAPGEEGLLDVIDLTKAD